MNTGIDKNYFTMVVLLLSALLSSCSPESKKEDLSNEDNNVFYYDSLVGSTNDSLKVYLKNDSLFFIMSNRKRVVVPWSKKNFYPDQKLKGIFILSGEQLEKQEVLEMGNKILYTILDEQYRGQMYVISLTDLSFYRDKKFNRDFLVSNSGMYLLDKNRERLIVVDKPILDEESEDMVSPIFIYEIKDGAFNLIDKSKVKGELIYSDSLVYSFFKDYIKSK
jgi:hypothetical protein